MTKRRCFISMCIVAIAVTAACTKPQQPPASAAPALDNSSEREMSYLIEREDHGKAVPVSEDFAFKSGDRFRLRFRPGFKAYIYVANRGANEANYKILFPLPDDHSRNPLAKGQEVALPGDSEWMRFDESPGNEYFVLIASTAALPDIEKAGEEIPRDTFEAHLAKIERIYRPDSSRYFRDANWTKLFAARDGELAIVVRLALAHT